MKFSVALLSAALTLAAAQPHPHRHQHLHNEKRQQPDAAWDATNLVVVPGPTVTAYVLNGNPISWADVQEGLRNGTLIMASNGQVSSKPAPAAPSTSVPAPPPSSASPAAAPTTTSSQVQAQQNNVHPQSSSQPASSPSAQPAPSSSSSSSSWGGSSSKGGHGVDAPFPDGQLDCSTFPSQHGAVPVDWMNLGGWTGIQNPGSNNGGFDNIETVTGSNCNGASCCTEGSFCSYACPAGYQKSQWPSTQGATGQSVGGLLCKGGKLHLTNPGLSKSLCMTGAEQVTILVQNKLSQNVAVCRTDYPGTEGETIPLDVQPGQTDNLTCPDANNYYDWKGSHTSAQYYVNPAGVSVKDACQWGSSANPWGNYAPLNLGVGYSNGNAWLSVFQNLPTTSAKLQFSVEIVGDGVSGSCKYSNGQYCSGSSCSSTTGCTVSISSGTATFVFS